MFLSTAGHVMLFLTMMVTIFSAKKIEFFLHSKVFFENIKKNLTVTNAHTGNLYTINFINHEPKYVHGEIV